MVQRLPRQGGRTIADHGADHADTPRDDPAWQDRVPDVMMAG